MLLFDGLRAPLLDADPGAAGGGGGTSAPVSSPAPSAPSSSPSSSPAPAPPSGDGGGADFDSLFDSVMKSSGASAPAATPTTQDTPAPAPAAEPSPEVPKPADAEAPKPAEVEAESDFDLDDDSDLDAAQADAAKPNLLDLKKSRGQRIYQSYKAYKAIADALGHEPSVEDVRAHFEAFSDQAAMLDDFQSGDPTRAANFVGHWGKLNPAAMEVAAAQIPEVLIAQGNQNAYVKLAMPVLNRFTNALYEQAQGEANPDLKKALLYTARMVDWKLNQKFRDDTALAQPRPQNDALAQREQAINQRFQQIQQYEGQQAAQAAQQWTAHVQQTNYSTLESAVDSVLKPLQATLPARIYASTKKSFIEDVSQNLAKDFDAQRLFDLQLNQSQRTRSDRDVESLKNLFMSRASRAIRQLAPVLLKEVGTPVVNQNAQTHAALAASAQAGVSPNTGGQPRSQSIAPTPKQYASRSEELDSTIDSLLGTKTRRI